MFLSLFNVAEVRADSNAPLRLSDLLAESSRRNPGVLAMRQRWEAEKSKIDAFRLPADPKVGLNLEKIRRGKSPKSKNAGTDMYMVEQDIPFPGKLSARKKAQIHAARISQYEYLRTLLEIQADVTAAYYEYWQLLESLRIRRAHSRILERFSNVTERQYASGRVMQRDVLRAQAEADKISVELSNLEERLPAVKTRLNALLNRPADSAPGIPEEPRVNFAAPDGAGLEAATIASNVDLKAAHHHIEHSRFLLKEAKLSFLPDFTAGWARMTEDGMPKVYNASLFLNVPLYFWKQRAQVRAAEADLGHAESEWARMRNEVTVDFRVALADIRNAARMANIYRTSVLPRSRKTLEVVESGYLANRAGFLDLLDAQQQLLFEELAYVNLLTEYGKARAILDRVTGLSVAGMTNDQRDTGGTSHDQTH
ncbi:MAG: hypothetical protein A3G34_02290 [Candidatus Lindowbacteria bacterium RIFCSPLOWO2_12_FULL_62_27]|nr:MAG: hypothetical protein A3G34_02290 [Candidatus Lindowbacteria bacterium RIFCSPLOWO2_12_FULL_62_27]OGH61205.1 MAG: hypothetical protein A3I06_15500 [Candidatus Lindowbacteria bacterium RIFCSPLOWO2_02_FULL_62_12]